MNYRTNALYRHSAGITTQNLGDFQNFKLRMEQINVLIRNRLTVTTPYLSERTEQKCCVLQTSRLHILASFFGTSPQFLKVNHVMLTESRHLLGILKM